MQTDSPASSPVNDRRKIQRNLDEKGSALLVVERADPANIMVAESYGRCGDGLTTTIDRNRVRCTTFGNPAQHQEFHLDDLKLYRSDD